MKILIFIESDLYYRNFIKSGAFDDLIKNHQVSFAYVRNEGSIKYNVTSDIEKDGLNIAGSFKYPSNRAKRIYDFTVISMVRLRHKSSTFMSRYKYQLSFKRKLLFLFLSWGVFYKMYKKFFMRYLGLYEHIYNIIKEKHPDLVIIPTSLIDSVAIDVILCSRALKINTLMLINGWDNISSKGTIPFMPDYLGVWGEQDKQHAMEIHNIPEERIFVLGAAQFSYFYREHNVDRKYFLQKHGIPDGKKVILFAGSARVFDETSILLLLESAIENGELGNTHILYRPHPWRHRRLNEDSFFNYDFKHVTMDSTLIDVYKKHKEQSGYYNLPSTVLPSLDYYPTLYKSVDAVICTLTTVMLEAAIFGLPVLAIAFSDNKHTLTMDKLINDKHFENIHNIKGLIVCRDRKRFIEYCKLLVSFSEQQMMKGSIQEAIKYIVYSDEKTYSQRLLEAVENIFYRKNNYRL